MSTQTSQPSEQNGGGNRNSPPNTAESHMASKLLSGFSLAMLLTFGAVFYLFAVTLMPIKVKNSLAYMSPQSVAVTMQPAVSQALADRSFTLLVDGKEAVFRLGDYEFTSSPNADGHSQQVTYPDQNGVLQTKVITTIGNLSFNETAVRTFINNLAKEYGTPMIEPHYAINGDVLTVYKGTDGFGIDFDSLMATICSRIKAGDYTPISTEVTTLKAPAVDIDQIYNMVVCEPADAYATEDSAGGVKFTQEVIGKDFDLLAARELVAQDADSWNIKLSLTNPTVYLKEVRAPYCLDELSTCTTKYGGSTKERANNVERAAENINTYGDFTDGYILQPGEEFSFNGVVGERTAAGGFMKAPVYVDSGSQEDYGGGICQVSTTLYCAALYANLQITERHNHLYVIHYWPTAGCDATVDWGHLDFKFKNNKEYPIKIKFTWENRKLTATISGTADGITAQMEREFSDYKPYETIYKRPTSEHPNGTSTGGDKGKVVKVWRKVYQDGKLISKEEESTNLYRPFTKTIYTNTLPEGAQYS